MVEMPPSVRNEEQVRQAVERVGCLRKAAFSHLPLSLR